VHGDGKGGGKFGFDCDGWICTPPEIVAQARDPKYNSGFSEAVEVMESAQRSIQANFANTGTIE
jgi:hypothetical protein